ncbi:MAG: Gfo/Idh/MocA family oxidoreductase [Verrucomicrobiota bacterium]|jgi:predicted dehydrogenase
MTAKAFYLSRRSFLKRCSLAAAATGLPAWFVERDFADEAAPPSSSPNERPGIALIGCGGMGRYDASNAKRFGDIVAVCDVDDSHSAAAAQQFAEGGKKPVIYKDFRKVMERGDIHIIITATPDHWHTLINLAAIKAGKDTYGEKPMTLTIDEGHHMVRAVRKSKVVFQTGTQQRSSARFRLACELVRNGRIGKLQQVTVWLPAGLREGPFSTKPVPPELNWDFWQGQAPAYEYVPQRCHTNFRFWYDYAGGSLTDWGPHHNDIALWGIGLPGPSTAEATALAQPIPGGYTAISDYEVHFTYSNGVRHTVKATHDDNIFGGVVNENGQRNGLKFEGSNGWIWVNRNEIEANDEALINTPLPAGSQRLYVSNDHMTNFFDCVRSRKLPIAEVEVGHRSASICHLAVIALRLGLKLEWDPEREKFTGANAKEASRWLAREMRKPYDYHFA